MGHASLSPNSSVSSNLKTRADSSGINASPSGNPESNRRYQDQDITRNPCTVRETCPTAPKCGVFRGLRFSLGRLVAIIAVAVTTFFPGHKHAVTTQLLDHKGRSVQETHRLVKDDIRHIISKGDPESQEALESWSVRTLLEAIVSTDLVLEPNFPLSLSDAQCVVDSLQQKIDRYHVPSPICDHNSEADVPSLLRVMCWISRRTSAFPEKISILSELDRPSREDYGPGGLHDIFRSEFQARPVILKHPRAFGMVRPSQRKTLEDEFRQRSLIAFNLHHENILPVWGIVDDPAFYGISVVSPWMEMGDLRGHLDRMTTSGRLSGTELVHSANRWLLGIAKGLEYMHKHGAVHSDIRGSNVLLNSSGIAQLTPFGSSAIFSEDKFSNPGLQSPIAWMAPELIDPKRFGFKCALPSLATDVYAFGCTCVELYTSQSPFPELRDAEILTNVLHGTKPQRPNKQGEIMPNSLWMFVRRCWDRDASRRPSMSEAVSVLTGLVG